jgi:hypothetical protein
MLVFLLPKVVAALLLKWQTGETYESRQEIRGSHQSVQLIHIISNPIHTTIMVFGETYGIRPGIRETALMGEDQPGGLLFTC